MASSADELLDRATGSSLRDVIKNGIGGVLLAISASIISGILSVADVFIKPTQALASALGEVVRAFLIEPLQIIIQGAQTSAESISPGAAFDMGPLTLLVGVLSVLAAYYVLSAYLQEDETSNVIPAAPFDISLPFFREEEGDERG